MYCIAINNHQDTGLNNFIKQVSLPVLCFLKSRLGSKRVGYVQINDMMTETSPYGAL